MKDKLLIFVTCFLVGHVSAQPLETELGLDGFFSASTFGGGLGLGAKYGFLKTEHLIIGPSIRYQRYWSNNLNTGVYASFNAYGIGGFVHRRFSNTLFLGSELEIMRSPINTYGMISGSGVLAPACFVGGGFSKAFDSGIRINAGLFYDLINHVNSPFRSSYFMKRTNGTYIPAIYRICFFFPL